MNSRTRFSTPLPDMAQERPRSKFAPDLLDLVRLRVAQIHECPVGQAHYTAKLQRAGESSARLERLENWPVSLVFTSKERTALALAELLAEPQPGDDTLLPHLLRQAQDQFSRAELVGLVVAVVALQEWDRDREVHHA